MSVCSLTVLFGMAIVALGSNVAIYSNTYYNVSTIHVATYGEHLGTLSARTMMDCTRMCSKATSPCRSAMFDVEQMLCSTNRWKMGPAAIVSCNPGDGCPATSVRKYANRYVKTTMRQPCNHDYDCVDPVSECRLQACACVPGYSFDSGSQQCVSECPKYGTSFQLKIGKRLIDNNDESFGPISLEDCKEMCVMTTSIVCRTIEYLPDSTGINCHLSSITAVTRPDLYETSPVNCELLTRDCL